MHNTLVFSMGSRNWVGSQRPLKDMRIEGGVVEIFWGYREYRVLRFCMVHLTHMHTLLLWTHNHSSYPYFAVVGLVIFVGHKVFICALWTQTIMRPRASHESSHGRMLTCKVFWGWNGAS